MESHALGPARGLLEKQLVGGIGSCSDACLPTWYGSSFPLPAFSQLQLQVNYVVWSRHQEARHAGLLHCAFHLRLPLNTDVLTVDDFGRVP